MRLVEDGPDIPAAVLAAHQNGKLVFFCGAGVSFPTLPLYRGLLEQIASRLLHSYTPTEISELNKGYLDRVASSLERTFKAKVVREKLKEILAPPESVNVELHKALLELSRDEKKNLHLVTTNYDGLFEKVDLSIKSSSAPALPVPKPHRWNSLVYLHGKISPDDPECRELVFTSSDFGRAYLSERWASAFVTELFRYFVVVFVGYSLEDPVMRYMMDALAAERESRDDTDIKPTFAFAPFNASEGATVTSNKWEEKGVTPIPYDERDEHRLLHETIKKWAADWNEGILSKRAIIHRLGTRDSLSLSESDKDQFFEAIREPDGSMANEFSRIDPAPPLSWLDVFEEEKLLDVPPRVSEKEKRPSPLVGSWSLKYTTSSLNPVTLYLGWWLARHLNEKKVVNWVVSKGCQLHPDFEGAIDRSIQSNTLREPYARIWRILASGACRNKSRNESFETMNITRRLNNNEVWTPLLRAEFLSILEPWLELKRSMREVFRGIEGETEEEGAPSTEEERSYDLKDLVSGEVKLTCGELGGHLLEAVERRADKATILRDIAWAVTDLLKETFELLSLVDEASAGYDLSYIHRPSISPHEQNNDFYAWTALVDLARDSHFALMENCPELAAALRGRWFSEKYPLFWRLGLDVLSSLSDMTPDAKLDFLLERDPEWLWSVSTQREVHQLLIAIWPSLGMDRRIRLTEAILSGLPAGMFPSDIEPEELHRIQDREVWRHLALLARTGTPLPDDAAARLSAIQEQHSQWHLNEGDRDTFPSYSESWTGHRTDITAEMMREMPPENLLSCLTEQTWMGEGRLDQWKSLVTQEPERGSAFLEWLSESNNWPVEIWNHTIYGVGESLGDVSSCWHRLFSLILSAPDELIRGSIYSLSSTLSRVLATDSGIDKNRLLEVWDKLLPFAGALEVDADADRIFRAINHPSGHLAEILLKVLFDRKPEAGSGIPEDLRARLTSLATDDGPGFSLARLILASRINWLYRIDKEWARANVLPRFSWENPADARDSWQGFLWIGRLTIELFSDLKATFLASFAHREELGKSYDNLCHILAVMCIDFPDVVTHAEALIALRAMNDEGRAETISSLVRYLAGAEDKMGALWNSRIRPWIENAWPRDANCRGPEESGHFAELAIATGTLFPEAVGFLRQFLTNTNHLDRPIMRFSDSGQTLARQFPRETLELLNAIVSEPLDWHGNSVRDVLEQAVTADPTLRSIAEYRRLAGILQRGGIAPP